MMAVMIAMIVIYPAFIAPLFNKFSPLKDEVLKNRIEDLLTRCGPEYVRLGNRDAVQLRRQWHRWFL